MRVFKLRLLLVCTFILFVGIAPVARGDWNPGDPHKMHYPQEPDPDGWDVCVCCQWIADDFGCIESGPVTDIHFWTSWVHDDVGEVNPDEWDISIWSDGGGIPGVRLWQWNGQGNVTTRFYAQGPQGWVCPSPPPWIVPPVDHWNYFQVNITDIPPDAEPFYQQADTVYWLVIRANITPMPSIGWKTSVTDPPGPLWRSPALWSQDLAGWQPVDTGTVGPELHDMAFVITGGEEEAELDHGDAPEGDSVNPVIAYPSLGVNGAFPTCRTILTSGYIEHGLGWARFEPAPGGGPPGWDPEPDGDAGLCPPPGCFPTYDDDECYADLDAGLMLPEPYTIDSTGAVVTCPQSQGTALGYVCNTAVWGQDIDIWVVNTMPVTGYVNVLMDWKQDGFWSGVANCIVAGAPEHVLVDWPVPRGYSGPLSGLMPVGTGFLIGPNSGFVWARFSITEREIMDPNWDGSGSFEDGETEDYLLRVDPCQPPPDLDFGDAPEPTYPTTLAANGARHTIVARMYLGSGVDAENDGQPHPQALGDDNDGNDDEDGVVFTSPLMPGTWATVDVNSNAIGSLDAWIDFGGDGSWAQPVDQIFASQPLAIGINPLVFWVPFGAQPGTTYARFRFSTAGGLSYVGQASDGEVEDYMVDIEDNPAIKWIQLPDTSPNGIDIKVTGQWLADDFECTSYGPITDAHLWCSWKGDEIGEIMNVHLSFHSDDPVGPGGSDPCNLYSQPDELKWERDFAPSEVSLEPVAVLPDGEWWWDPVMGDLIAAGDFRLWRMDIYINPDEAFIQRGDPCEPVIYWMDVRVDTEFGELGWKTRRFPEQFADDAVFHWGELPFLWKELRYPPDHPYHANSIDMAFVLTGEEWEPPKEPVPHLKWSQPPIERDPLSRTPIYCGWDELSYNMDYEDPCGPWKIVADDFRCLGTMPVSSVHWWGSHIDWNEPCLPAEQPSSWLIGFWSNVPANPDVEPSYSYPNVLLWQIEVDADRVDCEWVGTDEFPERPPEACFQYYVKLEPNEYFWQADFVTADAPDDIFWISIIAIYPDLADVPNPWGWKTRPWHWMDDAVTFNLHEPPVPGFSHGGPQNIAPIEDALVGGDLESYDVAFELDTEPNWIKWEQAFTGIRDWPHYEDVVSMLINQPITEYKWWQEPDPQGWDVCVTGWRLADDWQCNQTGPVSDIHFWVSWERDMPDQIFSIDVEIYSDNPVGPSGHSEPNELLWQRRFLPGEFDMHLYGAGDQGWLEPDGLWQRPDHINFYLINIDHIPDPHWQTEGTVYWLSIHIETDGHIGWKTTMDHWNDDAVYQDPSGVGWHDMYDPITGETIDLAFALTTERDNDLRALLADDWKCERITPVTAAVWWGSYIGYEYEACQPLVMPRPVKPDYFWLAVWDDVPANPDDPTSFSHPNDIIWEYNAYDYDEVLVGYDKHPLGSPREPVFRYSVRLPEDERFYQEGVDNIYWFSVVAVYDSNLPDYEWGWTNHEHSFNDDAVSGYLDPGSAAPEWYWSELYDQTGASEDMSFVLFAAGCRCWGDISGPTGVPDWQVSTSDMSALLILLGSVGPPYVVDPVPAGFDCMDLSGPLGVPDGKISTSDMSALLIYLGGIGPPYVGPCMPAP